jgi:hypothetical protein
MYKFCIKHQEQCNAIVNGSLVYHCIMPKMDGAHHQLVDQSKPSVVSVAHASIPAASRSIGSHRHRLLAMAAAKLKSPSDSNSPAAD